MKKGFICLCAITFILLYFANYQIPRCVNKYYKTHWSLASNSNSDDFEMEVKNACINIIESESWNTNIRLLANSKTLYSFLSRKPINVYEYGEFGYLLHFAFLYAEQKKDMQTIGLIKTKFDFGFRNFIRSDQIAYGCVAIDLFRHTHNKRYKKIADNLFNYLDSIDYSHGLVLYREGTQEQNVDAIGLVCPFLYYYARTFSVQQANEIANRMVEDYIMWGTDNVTGIPVQTYNVNSHIKLNHCNWGRGISWFMLGTLDYQPKDSTKINRISLLDSTLLTFNTHLYPQYFGQTNLPDMSATIPVIYSLYKKEKIKISKDGFSQMVSPYFYNGLVGFCSPSISFPHEDVNPTITSLWTQGLTLYLMSLLK